MISIATERNGNVTPFGTHGKLHVAGAQLMDEHQNPCQLKGISTHNISLYPEYVNEACFTELTDKFGMSMLRIAMYSAEADDVLGYADGDDAHRTELEAMILESAEITAKLGIYMIIDWHILRDSNPLMYMDQAADFFEKVAKKYHSYGNVFYELCNEPNVDCTWADIKKYAETIIPIIRKYDEYAPIIVGTPTWSQDVDEAVADPITGDNNLGYVLHFYADTHRDGLRKKLSDAADAKLPLFVSEFSICAADGNGDGNKEEGTLWLDLMDEYQISYCKNWNKRYCCINNW